MKVRCKANKLSEFDDASLISIAKANLKISEENDQQLKIGSDYIVFGIKFRTNYPWYYILEDEKAKEPYAFPAIFFDVIDDRFSSYWTLYHEFTEFGPSVEILHRNWGKNKYFYWDLIEEEKEEALKAFAQMRLEMEKEFE